MDTTNKYLLIVDDDNDDRNLFIEAVKEIDSDIMCMTADNGQQALEMLNDLSSPLPDYIVLDLRMPRYSDKRCLFEIKNSDRLKEISVIIYTTSNNVEESRELSEMGACHFMTKPRNADEIYYLASYILSEQWNDAKPMDHI
ncbi:MAG: response regulator [Chitinophagaceae bacterium]|nr:MAG: response regulator [Chitinophagaceae bacterium]